MLLFSIHTLRHKSVKITYLIDFLFCTSMHNIILNVIPTFYWSYERQLITTKHQNWTCAILSTKFDNTTQANLVQKQH